VFARAEQRVSAARPMAVTILRLRDDVPGGTRVERVDGADDADDARGVHLGHDGARRAFQGAEVVAGGLAVSTGKIIGIGEGTTT
jgi:hypothetical protein